jgi:DNA-binding NtrC family response regulator
MTRDDEGAMEGKQILVVDDEESIRFTFETFLAEEGYLVTTAGNYSEAVSCLVTDRFDLVFLDIILDGGSGIDLLKQIKDRNLSCLAVMMTGYPNLQAFGDAKKLGAAGFLTKPISQSQLLSATREALQS